MNKKVLSVITAIFIVFSFSACNTTNNDINNTTKSPNSEETVLLEYQSELLPYKDLVNYANSQYIRSYKFFGVLGVSSDDITPVNSSSQQIPEDIQNYEYSLYATNDLENSEDFMNNQRTILEGKFIKDTDKDKCIISKELSELNNKKIGDTITLKNSEDISNTKTFEITGIYSGELLSEANNQDSYPSPKNDIYVSEKDLGELNADTTKNSAWVAIEYILNSTDDFEKFEQELRQKGLPDSVIVHKLSTLENNSSSKLLEDIKSIDTFDGNEFYTDEKVTKDIFKQNDLTMINMWGTFCSPCIDEMTDLGEISREYKEADKKFSIIGVCTDLKKEDGSLNSEKVELGKQILEQTKADYLNIIPSVDMEKNLLVNVSVLPTTFFVDGEGNVIKVVAGAKDKKGWIEIIESLI